MMWVPWPLAGPQWALDLLSLEGRDTKQSRQARADARVAQKAQHNVNRSMNFQDGIISPSTTWDRGFSVKDRLSVARIDMQQRDSKCRRLETMMQHWASQKKDLVVEKRGLVDELRLMAGSAPSFAAVGAGLSSRSCTGSLSAPSPKPVSAAACLTKFSMFSSFVPKAASCSAVMFLIRLGP